MTYNIDLRIDEVLGVDLELDENPIIDLEIGESATSGTNDYEKLKNKPKINSVELIGDKSFNELGMNAISNIELEEIFSL